MQILRQEGHQRPQEVAVRKEGAPPVKMERTRKGLRKSWKGGLQGLKKGQEYRKARQELQRRLKDTGSKGGFRISDSGLRREVNLPKEHQRVGKSVAPRSLKSRKVLDR